MPVPPTLPVPPPTERPPAAARFRRPQRWVAVLAVFVLAVVVFQIRADARPARVRIVQYPYAGTQARDWKVG